jgi:DNA-binding transcriptional LysR family regulator
VAVFAAHRDHDWIVNSRGTADERAVRTLASMAGFEPRIVQRIDSLELVGDLVAGGFGVGLLPGDQPVRPGVRLLPLHDPDVVLRSYAVVRRGRTGWPPLALLLDLLRPAGGRDGRQRNRSPAPG